MTPAIDAARKNKVPHQVHEYKHDASTESYGAEAAQKLGMPEAKVFKTLVVNLDNRSLVVGLVPVSHMLSLKQIAKVAGGKKATMAEKSDVERVTGYIPGGVSPLGQKRRLRTFIDASAQEYPTIYISAGRRGLEIELDPHDLCTLTGGAFAHLCL